MRTFLDYLNDVAMGAEPTECGREAAARASRTTIVKLRSATREGTTSAAMPTAPCPFPVCKMLYEDSPMLPPANKGAVNRESQPPTPKIPWRGVEGHASSESLTYALHRADNVEIRDRERVSMPAATDTYTGSLDEELASERFLEAEEGE